MTKLHAKSHHQLILNDVLNKIITGTWPPGFRIPFETDMAETYGVSRMTMNKVLTQLTREGYLERRRKGGTSVASPRSHSAFMEIVDLKQEVNESGRHYSYSQLKRDVRVASDAELQDLNIQQDRPRILVLHALHLADGVPYCLENRIVNLEAIPEAEVANFETESAGSWLLRQVPWSSAEHIIRAVAASPSQAKLLDVASAAPCLEIDRLTRHAEQPLTFVRLLYPARHHQIVAKFAPGPSATNNS